MDGLRGAWLIPGDDAGAELSVGVVADGARVSYNVTVVGAPYATPQDAAASNRGKIRQLCNISSQSRISCTATLPCNSKQPTNLRKRYLQLSVCSSSNSVNNSSSNFSCSISSNMCGIHDHIHSICNHNMLSIIVSRPFMVNHSTAVYRISIHNHHPSCISIRIQQLTANNRTMTCCRRINIHNRVLISLSDRKPCSTQNAVLHNASVLKTEAQPLEHFYTC